MSLSNLGLDAFYLVFKHKTVIEASKRLGITQTGVTQRIRAIEGEIGASLFIRSKKGMRLTDAGEKLLLYCEQRRALEKEAMSKIKNEAGEIPVQIKFSASTYFMFSKILPLAPKLKADFPGLHFSFLANDNDDRFALLKKGTVDFAILPREDVALEMDSKLLKKRRYVLVGGKKAAKEKKNFTIIDFSEKDPFTDTFFKTLGIPYDKTKERHVLNNTLMFPSLLEKDIGVAVLDQDHFEEAKKSHDIYNIFPTKRFEIEWALAWLPRTEMSTYFKKIIDSIN